MELGKVLEICDEALRRQDNILEMYRKENAELREEVQTLKQQVEELKGKANKK